MRKSKPLWSCVGIFLIILALWLGAHFNYSYPVYEYHQTGEVVEFFDRASGLYVDAVPVFVPDNPLWVDVIRKIAPLSLVVLFMATLYFAIQVREKRKI